MIKKITDYFNKIGNKGVCIAFSGGVDSTVLLKLAALSGIKVIAVTFDTYLHPISDLQLSKDTAKEFGVEHYVIKVNELENHNVYSNPPDRCYHCKHILFSNLKDFARSKDIDVIIDGTNFDDLSEYRPGLKALAEFNVKSPLAELKITKNQVREIAEDLNLKVSKKPSSPCLATRLPYNTPIKPEYINMISLSEDYLKSKGFKNVRVRCYDTLARIEVDKTDIIKASELSNEIVEKLKEFGFLYVTLDLEGFRSGSMDIMLK